MDVELDDETILLFRSYFFPLASQQMDLWFFLLLLFLLAALNSIALILQDKFFNEYGISKLGGSIEGFENAEEIAGAVPKNSGIVKYLDNTALYDKFYASIYDQLTQGSVRTQAEVGLMIHEWTKRGEDKSKFEVLDVGCGTGIAVAAFAKLGVKRVVGLDTSEAMLTQAQTKTIPRTTLTEEQKAAISWQQGSVEDSTVFQGGQFTHAFLMYFTVYYMADKETMFRNLYYWIKPGGRLVVHVVNKHKFDPMLESSAPWLGFSLQKYSKERVTKSEVTFDQFKYTGDFDLQDPGAEFRETFDFQDGRVRRQKHTFRMEDMLEIVNLAKVAGWTYKGYTDLTPISFEYAYHLHFSHP